MRDGQTEVYVIQHKYDNLTWVCSDAAVFLSQEEERRGVARNTLIQAPVAKRYYAAVNAGWQISQLYHGAVEEDKQFVIDMFHYLLETISKPDKGRTFQFRIATIQVTHVTTPICAGDLAKVFQRVDHCESSTD